MNEIRIQKINHENYNAHYCRLCGQVYMRYLGGSFMCEGCRTRRLIEAKKMAGVMNV